jgi:hypothetical protein
VGIYLLPYMPGDRREALLNPLMFIPAWCLVTGTIKFLLVAVGGGGNALRIARRIMRQRNATMRPARLSWWRRRPG